MSATFRAGDRVKVVSYDSLGTESTNVGRTGTVSDTDSEYIFVNMDDVVADEPAEPFYADELELVEAAPVNVPADPDAEPQPYDMPSPEADALDRIAELVKGTDWTDEDESYCGYESAVTAIATILRETGRL